MSTKKYNPKGKAKVTRITLKQLQTINKRAVEIFGKKRGIFGEPQIDQKFVDSLNYHLEFFGVTTKKRLKHFLAQCLKETGGWQTFVESTYWSDIPGNDARMMGVYSSTIKTKVQARSYFKKPVALANHVYANKYGNGDRHTGDGYKYRGAGSIQITFKDTYEEFYNFVKKIYKDDPLILNGNPYDKKDQSPARYVGTSYRVLSAFFFWEDRGLNEIADKAVDTNAITNKVNLGASGTLRTDRQLWYRVLTLVLGN